MRKQIKREQGEQQKTNESIRIYGFRNEMDQHRKLLSINTNVFQ